VHLPPPTLVPSAIGQPAGETLAPIFILAESDPEAVRVIQKLLDVEWTYVSVREAPLVVHYVGRFATTAVFLADSIDYPGGGAARLLQDLLDRVGKPVVVMSEVWSPEVATKWKRMGAMDCIPHPGRVHERMEVLRTKMQDFALSWSGSAGPR